MFPLGSVLVPGMVLPLHVFEPRYRALVEVCLAGEPEFGVVLIERGSEVGGGDVRTAVGTVARIARAAPADDGRWALVTVGTRRIRVTAWLPDDPYPLAEVADWPDEPADDVAVTAALAPAVARLRRVRALHAELGEPTPPATIELADDLGLATYHAVALSPLGPADQQRLLAAPGPLERLALLDELLTDHEAVVRFRLGSADDG
jgi:Lon protease-like protein